MKRKNNQDPDFDDLIDAISKHGGSRQGAGAPYRNTNAWRSGAHTSTWKRLERLERLMIQEVERTRKQILEITVDDETDPE